jgi:hypothetical protein
VDNRSLVLFLSGLATAGAAVCIAVSCSDQPRAKCTTGRGNFTAVYTHTGGDTDGGCVIPGEVIAVQAYDLPNSDRSNADLNKPLMAIKGSTMANAIDNHPDPDPTSTHSPNSVGPFTTGTPGGDNFCDVPTLSVAEQDLPGVPEMPEAGPDGSTVPAIDPQHVKYEWSKVRVYVTPAANGVQMIGELTYTVDACSTSYHVTALFPSIGCGFDTSKDGPAGPLGIDNGPTIPDPGMCLPSADEATCGAACGPGHKVNYMGVDLPNPLAFGSGINPDLAVRCDPTLLLCVLSKEPPAFK